MKRKAMNTWTCCGKTYTMGKDDCRICGKAQPKYAPGPPTKAKATDSAYEETKRKTKNATARKLTKLNDVPGSFLISTLPGGPKK